jgi:hypothetical protein
MQCIGRFVLGLRGIFSLRLQRTPGRRLAAHYSEHEPVANCHNNADKTIRIGIVLAESPAGCDAEALHKSLATDTMQAPFDTSSTIAGRRKDKTPETLGISGVLAICNGGEIGI